jgi:hypothetical protein
MKSYPNIIPVLGWFKLGYSQGVGDQVVFVLSEDVPSTVGHPCV